jgi:opacity protein-like surface antigen
MRNKNLCIRLIFICSLVVVIPGAAQVLKNKLNMYVGYSIGLPGGQQHISNGSLKFPSLYNNISYGTISLQGLYNIKKHFSVGLKIESMKGANWQINSSDIYKGAEASFFLFAPVIQAHTSFQELGKLNRFKLHLNVQPIYGFASVSIQKPLSNIQYEGIRIFESGLSDTRNVFGLAGTTGVEFNLNQNAGAYANYSLVRYWLQSSLCIDTGFTLSKFEVGVYYRFLKNTRYYY